MSRSKTRVESEDKITRPSASCIGERVPECPHACSVAGLTFSEFELEVRPVIDVGGGEIQTSAILRDVLEDSGFVSLGSTGQDERHVGLALPWVFSDTMPASDDQIVRSEEARALMRQ